MPRLFWAQINFWVYQYYRNIISITSQKSLLTHSDKNYQLPIMTNKIWAICTAIKSYLEIHYSSLVGTFFCFSTSHTVTKIYSSGKNSLYYFCTTENKQDINLGRPPFGSLFSLYMRFWCYSQITHSPSHVKLYTCVTLIDVTYVKHI